MSIEPGRAADPAGACLLISSACTTGWFDWVHGELWICPDGLLRRRLGLAVTVGRALALRRYAQDRIWPSMTEAERRGIVAHGPGAIWLAWPEISRITLKAGIIDHSLHIQRTDGRRVKFLWPAGDGDFELLETMLRAAVSDRLVIHRAPVG
jgi:hypothetical protein